MRCLKCDSGIPVGFAACIKCGAPKPGAGPKAAPEPAAAPAPAKKPAPKKKGLRRPVGPSSVAVQQRLSRNIEGRAKPKSAVMMISGVGALIVIVGGGLIVYNYVSKRWESERGAKVILEETATVKPGETACFEVNLREHAFVRVHFSGPRESMGFLVNRATFSGTTITTDQVKDLNAREDGARASGGGMYIRGGSGILFAIETHCSPGAYAVFAANWTPGEGPMEVKVKVETTKQSIAGVGP